MLIVHNIFVEIIMIGINLNKVFQKKNKNIKAKIIF